MAGIKRGGNGKPAMSILSSLIVKVVLALRSAVTPLPKSDPIMPVPAPFCRTRVRVVAGCPETAVTIPPPIIPPEFIIDCTFVAISDPSD